MERLVIAGADGRRIRGSAAGAPGHGGASGGLEALSVGAEGGLACAAIADAECAAEASGASGDVACDVPRDIAYEVSCEASRLHVA